MTDMVYRWTQAAKECYDRGCVCYGCYYSTFNYRCIMKQTVLALVRKFGKPPAVVKSISNGNTYYKDKEE